MCGETASDSCHLLSHNEAGLTRVTLKFVRLASVNLASHDNWYLRKACPAFHPCDTMQTSCSMLAYGMQISVADNAVHAAHAQTAAT